MSVAPTGHVPLVELRGIHKRYPGVVALNDVSLSLYAGEILSLVGENGAGKSTLMKTLAGIVTPDEGEILIDGEPVRLGSPARAAALGIALVHQELAPLDNLDVAGNVFLGREPRRLGLLDRKRMVEETRRVLDRLGSR
ncbi:sugar ABC transporter ATP-binding protein, partial [bacterium]